MQLCRFDSRDLLLRKSTTLLLMVSAYFFGCGLIRSVSVSAQSLGAGFVNDFRLESVATGTGRIGQMAIGPDGRLYVARSGGSFLSFAYDPNAGTPDGVLTDQQAIISPAAIGAEFPNGSLGLALLDQSAQGLGTVLYTSVAVRFQGRTGSAYNESQSIRRLNDLNGDGIFGDPAEGEFVQDFITGLQVTRNHQTNNLLFVGNSLFFATGVRTCSGGDGGCQGDNTGAPPDADNPMPLNAANENIIGEYSYTGAVNYVADVTQIADTTTPNVAGMGITGFAEDISPEDGIADDLSTLTGAFADNGPGVFRVYSAGLRNPYGITADDAGNLLVTHNQQENPTPEDAVFETSQFADHGFDKFHGLLDNVLGTPNLPNESVAQVEGDYRTSANTQAARDAGFFGSVTEPFALLGNNSSSNGLATFASNARRADLRNDAIIARFTRSDVVVADRETGSVETFVSGIGQPLDVVRDPSTGNIFIAGNNTILMASEIPVDLLGDFNLDTFVDVADWNILKPNFLLDTTSMSDADALLAGDLNLSGLVDLRDMSIFAGIFDDHNGAGAFQAARLSVPEPGSWVSVVFAAMFVGIVRRRIL